MSLKCDKEWSDFNTAKSFYKNCGFNTTPNFDIKAFKTNMKFIQKELFKYHIFIIYVPWPGVGTEAQYIFDSAFDIIRFNKKYKGIDPYKSLKILYSEDMLFHLIKNGNINLIIDSHGFQTYLEKKDFKLKMQIINKTFHFYFNNNVKVFNNKIFIKI